MDLENRLATAQRDLAADLESSRARYQSLIDLSVRLARSTSDDERAAIGDEATALGV